jgi:glycosyltransferase involved in cell wall biosynthesis
MPPMRILHLVGRSQHRGAELVALELARELERLDHANTLLACTRGFDGASVPDLEPLLAQAAMGPRQLVAGAWELRRRLHRRPVDVVLAHGGWAVQVAALARRREPLLVWQRILGFGEQVRRPVRRQWWRFVAGRVDAAVALTPAMEREVRDLRFSGPVWPIANFRDPTRFVAVDRDRAGAILRETLGVDADVPLLGLVGHLIAQKRPERALAVLERVRATGVPAHLVVAGDGPLREQFASAADARRLAPYVHVLGHRNDVEQILGGLDLLLLTSDAEGIPGIVIEAQMAGCPVVTFPLGAVASVVDDGHTGRVLTRSDTDLMADVAGELLRAPATRRQMSDTGRRRAEMFSTRHAAAEYATKLEQLLAPNKR